MELVDELDLKPIKSERKYTFYRGGKTSKIDILCCSKTLKIESKVLQEDSGPDHLYVLHKIVGEEAIGKIRTMKRINWEKIDREKFRKELE